jgi:hypothetical protein
MNDSATAQIAAAQQGLYVYCVARAEGARLLGPIGLDGRGVYTVASGDLCAVVHDCPAQPYQSKDAQVLEAWATAHQDVVMEATKAFGTVLPMAFDMIVQACPAVATADQRTDGHSTRRQDAVTGLRAWLEDKRERFTRLLDRLDGKAEYGVQVFWDRKVVAECLTHGHPDLRSLQDEIAGKSKGLAHLLQTKLAKAVREAMEQHADSFAQDFYARVRQCVDDVRVDPLKKAEGDRQMILNLSCLMPRGSAGLGRTLDLMQQTPGVSVRFTGPWPPYSFVGA